MRRPGAGILKILPRAGILTKGNEMANSNQISNTSYYALPCGRQLEDFISWKQLDFFEGSALKYLFRAGMKDGEPIQKDMRKMHHYCEFIARERDCATEDVVEYIESLEREAKSWDGTNAAEA